MMKTVITLAVLLSLVGCASAPEAMAPPPSPAMAETAPAVPTGSLYATNSGSLFDDIRASHVGDILVVSLQERTDALKSSSTSVSRASSVDIANPILGGETREIGRGSNLSFDLESDHSFQGGSDSGQSNSLNGTIAVTVVGVMPQGNLIIEGEKWLNLNRGKEFIRLRGIVRPVDISPQNVVPSTRIANAEISYSGTGAGANANSPGWLSRFFIGKIWPF